MEIICSQMIRSKSWFSVSQEEEEAPETYLISNKDIQTKILVGSYMSLNVDIWKC